MYKIAVMGDKESIIGFSTLGIEIHPVNDKSVAASKLKELALNGYAVIFVTESLAASIQEHISKYKDSPTPAIILIPGVSGNTGEGMNSVLKSVERAVGSQIL
ncbi:MAG: V-type ATP synthase subunit F [Acutalibacteraceae bacterium]|nr:V-type ATP synthase subunit F [Acutalibacteraceae bacterium]